MQVCILLTNILLKYVLAFFSINPLWPNKTYYFYLI